MSADVDLEVAVEALKKEGYTVYKKTASKRAQARGIDQQKLWLCRWGTMTALVWARDEDNAELRVRHRCYNRYASVVDVERNPVFVNGEVHITEATPADLVAFEEAGGAVPA